MTKEEALQILTEMQKWRRSEKPYMFSDTNLMPYAPKQFGEAIDMAINILRDTIDDH